MSKIRSKDTKPEMAVRRALHRRGFRYSLHASGLPGKPDIVLVSHRTVVLVHGCFWHGHNCGKFRIPKTNTQWWTNKINTTRTRDKKTVRKLRNMGWRVCTVWECKTCNLDDLENEIDKIERKIRRTK